jgi:hypothetical protein
MIFRSEVAAASHLAEVEPLPGNTLSGALLG